MYCFTNHSHRGLLGPALLFLTALPLAAQSEWTTTRVSRGPANLEGNSASRESSVSTDGRLVAFSSFASNLVAGDTNSTADVFLLDRATDTLTLVDHAIGGGFAARGAASPQISEDGNWIGFLSSSPDLVVGDSNNAWDVFLYHIPTGALERVSVTSAGGEANQGSFTFALSSDAGVVAFSSNASNLVAGDTNGMFDVFIRDRPAGLTQRMSVNTLGVQGNFLSDGPVAISGDGIRVLFESASNNLVTADNNNKRDIFLRDRSASTTTRVSVSSFGAESNGDCTDPAISSDGQIVAFVTNATNLDPLDTNFWRDIYTRDLVTNTTADASLSSSGGIADDASGAPKLSAHGRYLAFWSYANSLVDGPSSALQKILLRDRQEGLTTRISRNSAGAVASHHSFAPSMSANSTWISFASTASNLIPADLNGFDDCFLFEHTLSENVPQRGSVFTMTAVGATPGESVFFTYSLNGLGVGPTVGALGFLTLDVRNPVVIMGSVVANAFGTATFSATVPLGAPLIPLATQAVLLRGIGGFDSVISNPLLLTIQP